MLLDKKTTILDKVVLTVMIMLLFLFTYILSNAAYYRQESSLILQMDLQKEVIKKLQDKVKEVKAIKN